MEFEKLIAARRSVRSYEQREISVDLIQSVLAEAQSAPSWKNSQTARCRVLYTAETLEKLRSEALPSFNAKSSANAVLIVTSFIRGISGYNGSAPANEAGDMWGAYDLGLHDAYLILAAKNAGLDTLIMGIRDAGLIRTALNIPEDEQIMSVIALGYGTAAPDAKPRKCLCEVSEII